MVELEEEAGKIEREVTDEELESRGYEPPPSSTLLGVLGTVQSSITW